MQQILTQGSELFKSRGHHDMGRIFRRGAGYERQPVITGHSPRKWRHKIVTVQVRSGLHVKC